MKASEINILIGCEESQAVCIEFRKLGFNAFSCDIQECSGGYPEWHYNKDIFEVIKLKAFILSDNGKHTLAIKEFSNLKKIEPNEYFKYETQIFFEKNNICEWSDYKKNKRKIENYIKENDSLTNYISSLKLLSITDSLEVIKKNMQKIIRT